MAYPPVIIVDEHDQEIGCEMLATVWAKGLNHRIVRIMVEDQQGNILLQKRNPTMVLFPGCWDNSAAGHVDKGMTYLSAAVQEIEEELGIANPQLEETGHFYTQDQYRGRKLYVFHKVYRLRLNQQQITLEPAEVSEVRWVKPQAAKRFAEEHPDQVTFGLSHVLGRYY